MGLFDKKTCELCGDKASMLGKKKIQDGYLCGECKKQLSEFSSGWKERSVDQVRDHIAQREANKQKYAQFSVEESLGPRKQLKIDRTHGWFIFAFGRDWKQENPEVFSFDQLREFYLEIGFDRFGNDNDGDGIPDHLQNGAASAYSTMQTGFGGRRGETLNADSVQNLMMMQGLTGLVRMEQDAYDNQGFPREVDEITCVIGVSHPYISEVKFSTSSLDNSDPDNQREINAMIHVVKTLNMLRNAAGMGGGMQAGMQGGMGAGMPGGMAGQPGMQPGMAGGTGAQPGMQGGMGGQPAMGGSQPGMQGGMGGAQSGMQGGMPGNQPAMGAGQPGAAPQGQPGAPSAGAAQFCSSCGTPLSGTPFCASCGTPTS